MKQKAQYIFMILGFFFLLAITLLIVSEMKEEKAKDFSTKVIELDNGFGYEVRLAEKLIIRQLTVPAVQGNKPFATFDQANETAKLVVKKLKKGQNPVLSRNEVDSLGVAN